MVQILSPAEPVGNGEELGRSEDVRMGRDIDEEELERLEPVPRDHRNE